MKRWPLKETYFWERAPFFRLLLPLVVGILCYQYIQFPQYLLAFSLSFVLLISLYSLSIFAKQNTIIRTVQFLLIQLALIAAGWLSSYQYDIQNNKYWFGNNIDEKHQYAAHITNKAEEKNRTWKYEVEITSIIYDGKHKLSTGKAYLYVYKYSAPAYQEGDVLLLPNEWQRIKNAGNPHEFNYAQFCAYKNIYYQQFLPGKKIKILKYATENTTSWIRRIHNWCTDQLETYIIDRKTLGLLEAILAGERSTLDRATTQNYANVGIVHVIAISGAHISIFFFLVLFLLSSIKHRKYRWVKYLTALPLIWLYVLVAGAPPSAVRAALMFSILGVGFAFQKQQNGINQLLTTAFILLLVQPTWLFAVGFQLSFLAVLSLFLFYKPIYRLLSIANKPLRTIWGVIAASIAAEILIAPLVIYYFHLFPLQFILANIIAYFFMSIILILGMAIIAFSSLAPVATILASLSEFLVTYFNRAIETLAPLNPESFQYLQISKVELLLLYLGIISIATFIFNKKKQAMLIGVMAVLLLLTSLIFHSWQARHQERLVVYNINGTGYIEHIKGKKCHILSSSKALSEQTLFYALRPAHTQWHAWRQQLNKSEQLALTVNNQKVLIINSKKDILPDTLVDILIINYNAKEAELQKLITLYKAKQLVFSSILSRKKATSWADKRQEFEIPIHIVGIDGAFIVVKK